VCREKHPARVKTMNLPNKLTISRIILSPVFMIIFLLDDPTAKLIGLIIFAIAALTDLGDGYLARRLGRTTGFGKFMDPLADKILTSTAFIALVATGHVRAWMVALIIAREFVITGFRLLAAYRGMVILPTFLARLKTFLQMFSISVILLYVYLEAAWLETLVGWGLQPGITITYSFDGLVLLTTIITVGTGVDYVIKYGGLLKNVLK
jgi:CDP-diacylglycerol--glycerol-3-phosphate 3-phosphatidyltransferase